jgi:hypothetical protein
MLVEIIEVPYSWKYLSEAASNLGFMCVNKFYLIKIKLSRLMYW